MNILHYFFSSVGKYKYKKRLKEVCHFLRGTKEAVNVAKFILLLAFHTDLNFLIVCAPFPGAIVSCCTACYCGAIQVTFFLLAE